MSDPLQRFNDNINHEPVRGFFEITPVTPTCHYPYRIRRVPQKLLIVVLGMLRLLFMATCLGIYGLILWGVFGTPLLPVPFSLGYILIFLSVGLLVPVMFLTASAYAHARHPLNHRRSLFQRRRAVILHQVDFAVMREYFDLRQGIDDRTKPRISVEHCVLSGSPPVKYRVRIKLTGSPRSRLTILVRPFRFFGFGRYKDCAKVADMELVELLMLLKSARY